MEVLYSGCRKDRVKGDIRVEMQDLWVEVQWVHRKDRVKGDIRVEVQNLWVEMQRIQNIWRDKKDFRGDGKGAVDVEYIELKLGDIRVRVKVQDLYMEDRRCIQGWTDIIIN